MTDSPGGYNPLETQAEDRLPRERLRPVGVGRVVMEWLVAGLVVVVLNFAAMAVLDRYDPNRFRVQVGVKYEVLREQGGSYDSLILGDSTPNQGVMPAVLNDRVGGSWANLATVADMLAASDVWLLTEFVDLHGPPERVLVCHVPDMWARDPNPLVLAEADVPLSGFDDLDPPLSLGLGEKWGVFKSRYLPLYSKNDSLSVLLMKPWKAKDLRGLYDASGFMSVDGQEPGWSEAIAAAKREHEEKAYKLSAINEQAMTRLIELAEQHGFTVYLTPGSCSRGLAQSPGYRRNFSGMIQQYRAWADASERVVLILPEPQVFADAMMFDEDHVNAEGAEAWTGRIADAILESERSAAQPEVEGRP